MKRIIFLLLLSNTSLYSMEIDDAIANLLVSLKNTSNQTLPHSNAEWQSKFIALNTSIQKAISAKHENSENNKKSRPSKGILQCIENKKITPDDLTRMTFRVGKKTFSFLSLMKELNAKTILRLYTKSSNGDLKINTKALIAKNKSNATSTKWQKKNRDRLT